MKQRTLFIFKCLCFVFALIKVFTISAEPWIDVRDAWLRADIETLSDIGIITVPITTYPIMWSGIVKDFDNTNIEDVPELYKSTFWRVKKLMKAAFRKQNTKVLRLSAATSTQVFRDFGDGAREKAEVSARNYSINDNWAWNIEVTYALDPYDGDNVRLDGSYLATVLGNWNFSVGMVERWWGPSWDSANIVSSNARPTPSLMIQRNYSEYFDSKWLKWIGPWTVNAFIGLLDDDREIKDAKLIGMSINFKPFNSLEVGLRRSAQWGGEGRPEDFSSFVDLLLGYDNCGSGGIDCSIENNEPGNQLAGIDLRWRLPLDIPSNIYFSIIGEDEASHLPSKQILQLGFASELQVGDIPWKWYFESTDTAVLKDRFNIAYEHHIYRTGYRYNGMSIGSTYDNDSLAYVFGLMGRFSKNSSIYLRLSNYEINRDSEELFQENTHTISSKLKKVNRLNILWQQKLQGKGTFKINFDYFSNSFDEFERQEENYRLGLDWTYLIN